MTNRVFVCVYFLWRLSVFKRTCKSSCQPWKIGLQRIGRHHTTARRRRLRWYFCNDVFNITRNTRLNPLDPSASIVSRCWAVIDHRRRLARSCGGSKVSRGASRWHAVGKKKRCLVWVRVLFSSGAGTAESGGTREKSEVLGVRGVTASAAGVSTTYYMSVGRRRCTGEGGRRYNNK